MFFAFKNTPQLPKTHPKQNVSSAPIRKHIYILPIKLSSSAKQYVCPHPNAEIWSNIRQFDAAIIRAISKVLLFRALGAPAKNNKHCARNVADHTQIQYSTPPTLGCGRRDASHFLYNIFSATLARTHTHTDALHKQIIDSIGTKTRSQLRTDHRKMCDARRHNAAMALRMYMCARGRHLWAARNIQLAIRSFGSPTARSHWMDEERARGTSSYIIVCVFVWCLRNCSLGNMYTSKHIHNIRAECGVESISAYTAGCLASVGRVVVGWCLELYGVLWRTKWVVNE